MTDTDFITADHGSLIGLTPLSPAAHDWVDDSLSVESWQRFGPAIMLDHSSAQPVIEAILFDGLTVKADPQPPRRKS
jgi:hypothetical protein